MTKRIRAKHKIDRRLGENIWGRPKSPLNARKSRPGQHGERRVQKLSDYGQQLRAKQKLKGYYGNITERQFHRIYNEAVRLKGSTSEHLIGLLERRLDAVVYRAKFVPTVFAARQFVSHGHVTVNGRRVTIPSYRCKVGDVIEIKEKSRQAAAGAGGDQERRARRARLHRGRPQQDDAPSSCACRRWPTCPTRCTWSRTWWSSSTRASKSCAMIDEARRRAGPFAFSGDCHVEANADQQCGGEPGKPGAEGRELFQKHDDRQSGDPH